MSQDATFEDGAERPVNIGAMDADDLQVISALVQDAVFPATEMRWDPKVHRFAILLNRFRWEDLPQAERRGRSPERTQCVLVIDHVLKVASSGVDRSDKTLVLSLLSMAFEAGEDGTGVLHVTLAGDGALKFEVEALEVGIKDVTRPYAAPSGKAPQHPES